MFCPNCGSQLPDGSKFCPKCGTSLDSSQQPAPAPAPAPMPTQQAPSPQPPITPQKKQRKMVKIGKFSIPLILVVGLLGKCGMEIYKQIDKRMDRNESPAITQPETQPSSSATLEDVLRDNGTLDELVEQVEQAAAQSEYVEMYAAKDFSVSIDGNMITCTTISSLASTDSGSKDLVSVFLNDLSDESAIRESAETIKSLEQEFGVEGIQVYEVYECSDGFLFANSLYDSSGLVDYDVAKTN